MKKRTRIKYNSIKYSANDKTSTELFEKINRLFEDNNVITITVKTTSEIDSIPNYSRIGSNAISKINQWKDYQSWSSSYE